MAIGSLQEIVMETPNPEALARFWQAMIGGDVEIDGDDWASLENDDGYFVFSSSNQRATSTSPSTIRLNVEVDDLDIAVDEAEQLGAAKQGAVEEDDDATVQYMVDPGGFRFSLSSAESG